MKLDREVVAKTLDEELRYRRFVIETNIHHKFMYSYPNNEVFLKIADKIIEALEKNKASEEVYCLCAGQVGNDGNCLVCHLPKHSFRPIIPPKNKIEPLDFVDIYCGVNANNKEDYTLAKICRIASKVDEIISVMKGEKV